MIDHADSDLLSILLNASILIDSISESKALMASLKNNNFSPIL